MNASILVIGDEILIGQVLDTNSNWMAKQLNLQGIRVSDVNAIADNPAIIKDALENTLKAGVDLVLITGGLGPTKDDMTKKTLAEYFGHQLTFHQPSWENLQALFRKFNRVATEEYKDQCLMPDKATILINKTGTASGMWFEDNGQIVVSMPGVPFEMKYLMENEVLPKLKASGRVSPIAHKTILTHGMGETQLMGIISEWEDNLPEHIKLAYLPYLGGVRLRMTARGQDDTFLQKTLGEQLQTLMPLVEKIAYGFDDDSLESVLYQTLLNKGLTFCVAESCTGGYISHRLTKIPGVSDVFKGGIIAYANEAKIDLLDVNPETLATYGAVSEETVAEMAIGAMNKLCCDIAIGTSGIAGPGGGTPDKPVGTICVAIASKFGPVKTYTAHFGRSRELNIELSANSAIYSSIRYIEMM